MIAIKSNTWKKLISNVVEKEKLFFVIFNGIDDCINRNFKNLEDIKRYLTIVENILLSCNCKDKFEKYCQMIDRCNGIKTVKD